jgi:serine/threonine protein kinase
MSLVSLVEGSVFAGRYRIVRSLAQGGMGAVYEVVHTETQRRRALKVMLPNMLQSQDMRDRFRQEACVTANIESEHIVDVLDAGIDEKTQMPFLVMELLRGEELDKRLKRLGRLDPREVVTFLHQVALALDKTHRASIVHRDLKPGNVFLTEREDGSLRAKILDFGVAKLMAEGATSAGATQSLGTPLYMAPEQFNIGQKVSPAVDIFSLGMMAYTLLVGVSYWADEIASGANIYAFAARAMHGPAEAATARAIRQGVALPAAFDAWFAKVTAASPQARFPTASAATAALAEALGVADFELARGAADGRAESASVLPLPEPSDAGLRRGCHARAYPDQRRWDGPSPAHAADPGSPRAHVPASNARQCVIAAGRSGLDAGPRHRERHVDDSESEDLTSKADGPRDRGVRIERRAYRGGGIFSPRGSVNRPCAGL